MMQMIKMMLMILNSAFDTYNVILLGVSSFHSLAPAQVIGQEIYYYVAENLEFFKIQPSCHFFHNTPWSVLLHL